MVQLPLRKNRLDYEKAPASCSKSLNPLRAILPTLHSHQTFKSSKNGKPKDSFLIQFSILILIVFCMYIVMTADRDPRKSLLFVYLILSGQSWNRIRTNHSAGCICVLMFTYSHTTTIIMGNRSINLKRSNRAEKELKRGKGRVEIYLFLLFVLYIEPWL